MKKKNFKKGSESSSELSVNENSEQESNSFIIQKKKKLKKCSFKQKYLETSPNKRFGRYEEKKFSEINHTAYLGIDHDRGCDVLWNVINISSLNYENKQTLLLEFNKYKNLHHENVSGLIDFWEKDNHTVIFITDYFTSGSIRQYLMKIGKQKLKVVKSWMKMILCGLEYLHKQEIFLRNLNCGRIFYNGNNGIVSIGEIYMASKIYQMIFYDNINTSLDSEKFMINCQAPEILKKTSVTDKSDIYSLGMVLIEMLSLEIPFNEIHSQVTIREKIIEGFKPLTIEKISDSPIKKLLDKLLQYDPKLRPSIKELLTEEFIKINEKEDNRIVPIIKLKKRTKRLSVMKNSSNFFQSNNYITTPYQSAVPDDYLMSSSNQIRRQQTNNDLSLHNESFFNNQKAYVNQRLHKHNFYNSNQNNFSLTTNNYSNLNVNSTLNNIHDLSHERHKRTGMHNMSRKVNKKKLLLFKHDFEENPYFEESLRLKMENEMENNNNNNNEQNNNYGNAISKGLEPQTETNNKATLGNTTPTSKVNKDPMYFLNQNNFTTNDQIKEYLNNKTISINRKNRTSADLDDNYDNNNNPNAKSMSDSNQNYPDNLSGIQSNYNRETLYNNSSQGLTNRNSNNTISAFTEQNVNYKSQNSNNFYNSGENQNNYLTNLTPRSICNNEMIFSKNLFNSTKEVENVKSNQLTVNNPEMNSVNLDTEDANKIETKKKKNKSVSWMNFDNKIYDVIGSHMKNETDKDNQNEILNSEDKEGNLNPQFYSSENLNQIIEKIKSNNFDPIFSKYGIPNDFKNETSEVNVNCKSTEYDAIKKEDNILQESQSHINKGFVKYSKDSSSLIDSDNLMSNNYEGNKKNSLIINNSSNISSEKNTNNIVKEIKSEANDQESQNIEIFQPALSQENLTANYLKNECFHMPTNQEEFLKQKSESAGNIVNYNIPKNNNVNNDINDLDLLINENENQDGPKPNINQISSGNVNGINSCYNVRNSSSDSLMHFNALQGKNDLGDEEEEYANLANQDAANEFIENNNNNNNNNIYNKPKYQIFDSNYDVHLKFMINQDSKIHEIQFTYNLLKDNIPDLMGEIQNEFNFSSENLNHIYETLKKISIYSKFYCNSDILHDNSF